MSKSLGLIILLSICNYSMAQFSQAGQKLVNGSVFFNSTNTTHSSLQGEVPQGSNVSLNLNAGKFNKTNVLTSIGVYYAHSTSKQVTPTNTSTNLINAVGLSYSKTYYKQLAKQLFIGIGGSIGSGYNSTIVKNDVATNGSKFKGYFVGLNVAPILNYQITKRFVISVGASNNFLGIAYNYGTFANLLNNQVDNKSTFNSFNFNSSLGGSALRDLGFGVSYLLK